MNANRKRPIPTQPRYRLASDVKTIQSTDGLLWVIISYRASNSARRILVIPCSSNPYERYRILVGQMIEGGLIDQASAPTLAECMSGALPSLLGITSTSIDGAWISPICPLMSGTYSIVQDTVQCIYQRYSIQKGTTYGAIQYLGYSSASGGTPTELSTLPYKQENILLNETIKTTDAVTYAITDVYGNVAGTAPYDMEFDRLSCIVDIGNVSCFLKVTFNTSNSGLASKTSDGLTVTLPLPVVPISSSAYSDYVYSGQRDYEKDLASLQNEQTAVHGMSGAIGGAVIGAVIGSVAPGAGTAIGAVGGAVAGGVSQIGSAGINYAVDEFIYKDKFQDLEDKKYSNQTGNLVIPSDGFGWLLYGVRPKLIALMADDVSREEIVYHIMQEGYPCDSPVLNVTPYLQVGGPIQIRNLIITGEIPPVAKRTIKSLLETGIRIQENNAEGVEP